MSNSKENIYIKNFTKGNVSKQLILFAAPLFISSLLQIVYNMVDMIIVGQVTGKTGLSAVAIGGDVTNFLTFLSMGFSNAGQVIIAQYVGAERTDKVSRFIGTMFFSLLTASILLSIICLFFKDSLLQLMNTPKESYALAEDYISISIAGLVFVYGYNMGSAVLRGMGDAKHPFIFISIAAILNVILDIIFVCYKNMNAAGAALATVISQGTSFLLCIIFLWKNQFRYHLRFETGFAIFDKEMFKDLLKLGLPMAIKSAAIHFSKVFTNSWINSYGIAVSAMAGIANKFNSISNLFSNSVNTAGSSMVGQNIGAEKFDRVKRIMLTAFGITICTSSFLSIIMISYPEIVFRFFTKDNDVLKIAMEYLPISLLIFLSTAFRAPMNALINGSGNYKINFVTAILDGFIFRIGLALLLGLTFKMQYIGFWLGDALAGFTPFIIGLFYYFSGKWKKRRF